MHVQQFWSFFFFFHQPIIFGNGSTWSWYDDSALYWAVLLLDAFGAAKDTLLRSELLFLEKRALSNLVFKGEKIKTKKTRIIQFNEWNVPCFLVNFWCGWALLLGDFSEQFLHRRGFFFFLSFLHNFFQAKKKKHFTPYPPQSPAITRRTRNHSPQPTPN